MQINGLMQIVCRIRGEYFFVPLQGVYVIYAHAFNAPLDTSLSN